jgi:copper(I)-binding protein
MRFGDIVLATLFLAFAGDAFAQSGAVEVSGAWARATPPHATNGVAYFTLTSPAGDSLTGASTPVAARAELHRDSIDAAGVMSMRPVTELALPPGQAVELKPGGLHLMLRELKHPLKLGETFPLTLVFAKAGKVETMVTVEKAGASGPDHMHHMPQ